MQRAKPKITIIAIFHLMGTFSTFSNYIFSRENSETRAYGTAMKNQLKNCEKLERQLLAIFSELSGNRRSAFPARLSKVLPAFWRRRRQRQRWISCSEKPGKPRGKRVPPEATGVAGRKTASTWHPQTTAGNSWTTCWSCRVCAKQRTGKTSFLENRERERECKMFSSFLCRSLAFPFAFAAFAVDPIRFVFMNETVFYRLSARQKYILAKPFCWSNLWSFSQSIWQLTLFSDPSAYG